MKAHPAHKRLDELECYLTPKDWALQLVAEMRKHPDEESFLKSILEVPFEDCILFKPFMKLRVQSERRYPGKEWEDVEARRGIQRELQTECQKLKLSIKIVNDVIKERANAITAAVALLHTTLNMIIQEDRFAAVAGAAAPYVERNRDENCESLLYKLNHCGSSASRAREVQELCESLVAITRSLLECNAGLRMVEDRYFDGRSILRSFSGMLRVLSSRPSGTR